MPTCRSPQKGRPAEHINDDRRRWLGVAATTVLGAGLGLLLPGQQTTLAAWRTTPTSNPLQSLSSASAWLNSPPLTEAGLRGKVVLIDVCTYTCINWLRTLPYIRAWAEKYAPPGLVVIGVHAPEFAFEHDLANVRRAVKDMRIEYPIAIDNDFVIWRAFKNRYWPALYLVDSDGRIRHQQFGEGEYEQSERAIQRCLADAGVRNVDDTMVAVKGQGIEAEADWASLKSPENYLGYERTDGFATGDVAREERHVFAIPAELQLNQWALSGDWTMKPHSVVSNGPSGRISYRFHARDVHLVMGPASRGTTVRFRVRIGGQVPGAEHGIDVDQQGNGTLSEQRLHQLVRQRGPVSNRQFAIEFLDAGAEAFAFTFG